MPQSPPLPHMGKFGPGGADPLSQFGQVDEDESKDFLVIVPEPKEHHLTNGMIVQNEDDTPEINRPEALDPSGLIRLPEPKLSETYDNINQEWQAHHSYGELKTLVQRALAENEQRYGEPISNSYFLTPKWPIYDTTPMEERDPTPEERKALFLLAVFNSICQIIGKNLLLVILLLLLLPC